MMMIHSDHFSYKVTDKTSVAGFAGDLAPGEDHAELDGALVAFVSVEKEDEADPQDIADQAAIQIRATADKVGADRVMVYPYAHLSSDLASSWAVYPVNRGTATP
jgi:threonyl-tRNA synthetase